MGVKEVRMEGCGLISLRGRFAVSRTPVMMPEQKGWWGAMGSQGGRQQIVRLNNMNWPLTGIRGLP